MAGAGAAGEESSQTPQLTRGTRAGAPACAAFTAEAPLLPKVPAGGRHVGVLLGPLTSCQHRVHCFPARHPLWK